MKPEVYIKFHLPKAENAKQSQCPEEKKAITKGLRGIEIWQIQ